MDSCKAPVSEKDIIVRPMAVVKTARKFAFRILLRVLWEKRMVEARTPIDEGSATRNTGKLPMDWERPCRKTGFWSIKKSVRKDTAKPKIALKTPARRSREVRSPRPMRPMM